jgi:glyoxylase-like metal-dependent hydrolase (beta-lactamase superfamily II)
VASDRKNGLLFTGDTFYPGPIYLFVPETDFAAYARSVALPVAEPFYLKRLADAVQQVQHAKVKSRVTEGHREYSFDGFSLLLSDK